MNLLKQEKKKSNYLYLILLSVFYVIFVFVNRQSFFQKFNSNVVDRYLRSQDIEDRQNLIKDRIFISDSDIYIASGYLYVNGAKPTDYNFQHPPFVKYLFGLSSKYFNLPLLPNVVLGFFLLLEVYILGKLAFKSNIVGILSSTMLMFDPVFKEVTTYALLDLGQTVFILGFLITTLFYSRHVFFQGIFLGLSLASKFYSPVLVLLGTVYIYKLVVKQFDLKKELLALVFAFIAFCLVYFKSLSLNIFFEQGKIIKFMVEHNQAAVWGRVIPMFFWGYFVWPILFVLNIFNLIKFKKISPQFLFFLIPILYLVMYTFQIPFTRYFIFILPLLYLSLGKALTKIISMV